MMAPRYASAVRATRGPAAVARGIFYVSLSVEEHSFFKRRGNDILYDLPVSFVQAALGDEVEVPTVDSPVNIKIPPGTQTGKLFRLKDKRGAPSQGWGQGLSIGDGSCSHPRNPE